MLTKNTNIGSLCLHAFSPPVSFGWKWFDGSRWVTTVAPKSQWVPNFWDLLGPQEISTQRNHFLACHYAKSVLTSVLSLFSNHILCDFSVCSLSWANKIRGYGIRHYLSLMSCWHDWFQVFWSNVAKMDFTKGCFVIGTAQVESSQKILHKLYKHVTVVCCILYL